MMRLVLRLYREVPAFCQRVTSGAAVWSLASVGCCSCWSRTRVVLFVQYSFAWLVRSFFSFVVPCRTFMFSCSSLCVCSWDSTFAQIVFYLQRANAKFGGQKEWQKAVAALDRTLRKHLDDLAQAPSDPMDCSLAAIRGAPIWMRSVVRELSDLVHSLQITEATLEAWRTAQEVGSSSRRLDALNFMCFSCDVRSHAVSAVMGNEECLHFARWIVNAVVQGGAKGATIRPARSHCCCRGGCSHSRKTPSTAILRR